MKLLPIGDETGFVQVSTAAIAGGMIEPISSCIFVFQNKSITQVELKALVCSSNMVFNGVSKVDVSRRHSLTFTLVWRGPLDTPVLMEDQLLRTTSNKSVDRASGKGNRSGGSMGSSIMNGWRGVVSSLFALFGNGGETVNRSFMS